MMRKQQDNSSNGGRNPLHNQQVSASGSDAGSRRGSQQNNTRAQPSNTVSPFASAKLGSKADQERQRVAALGTIQERSSTYKRNPMMSQSQEHGLNESLDMRNRTFQHDASAANQSFGGASL